jgi:hypothetical protein
LYFGKWKPGAFSIPQSYALKSFSQTSPRSW